MDWYKIIKWFYDNGLWTKEQVVDAVSKEKITVNQYKQITGEILSE